MWHARQSRELRAGERSGTRNVTRGFAARATSFITTKMRACSQARKTFLFLEKMSTRNIQPTPKMISKSSVPIDLFTAGCVENLGTDSGLKVLKTTDAQLVLVEVLPHPFRSTVEVKREILAIFHILLEALQPHLC